MTGGLRRPVHPGVPHVPAAIRPSLQDHTFDKLRSIDIALAEFVTMLDDTSDQAEVIAVAHESDPSVKELVLLVQWKRPLHVVIVVDDDREQERVATVYEPYPSDWTADFRRRH